MQCKDIMAMIEGTYPKSAALGFDNVGLQAGRSEKEVRRIIWRWIQQMRSLRRRLRRKRTCSLPIIR